MILLALATLLWEGTVSVPPSHWKVVDIPVNEPGVEIRCTFAVAERASNIQAQIVTARNAERFSRGQSFSALASTGFERDGTLRYVAEEPAKYFLLLDNPIEARHPTEVALKIELLKPEAVRVRTLPPGERRVIVLLSVLFFLGVVAFSARKLMA
jgi:hypothetical protein